MAGWDTPVRNAATNKRPCDQRPRTGGSLVFGHCGRDNIGREDVALQCDDEPDTPSALNFAGRQSRPDQSVTCLWRYPKSTCLPLVMNILGIQPLLAAMRA
jgi:hypothetical protein